MTKTCSVKKRESVALPMMGAAQQEMHQRRADDGHAAHDGGADAETPVRVLIEAQHLAGEGHAERQQQKKHADDPGKLARKLICPEHEDLHHVDEHNGDHEVRSPTMQRAQKPAQLQHCC